MQGIQILLLIDDVRLPPEQKGKTIFNHKTESEQTSHGTEASIVTMLVLPGLEGTQAMPSVRTRPSPDTGSIELTIDLYQFIETAQISTQE